MHGPSPIKESESMRFISALNVYNSLEERPTGIISYDVMQMMSAMRIDRSYSVTMNLEVRVNDQISDVVPVRYEIICFNGEDFAVKISYTKLPNYFSERKGEKKIEVAFQSSREALEKKCVQMLLVAFNNGVAFA